MIAVTAPPAAETGKAGAGVGVGSSSVAVEVGVEVGQDVEVGRMVGVEVGWVGVGVLAARMIIFWFTKIVDLSVRPFSLRISARGTLYDMLSEPSVSPGWTMCTTEPSALGVLGTSVGAMGTRGAGGV